jgi:BirA family transcriptional regulator, biotin operon repressor / biotin---[acetyl-CoA-carboxylase] ligase
MNSATTDRKIDKLVNLFVKNATVVIPGPKIASEIGVTRSTVWDYIERLRELGVDIKGHPATGYQLRKLPDLLLPSLIRPELGDHEIGQRLVHFFRTGSTNDDAFKLAMRGAPHGTVIVAEEQTAGRGRYGRPWVSEKSMGIYSSTLLRPPLSPAAAPILSLAAGVAVHRAIASVTGLAPDIRWPNDVLLNGKKVSGILTEMQAELDRMHAVVLGIGINVNQREMPPEIRAIATSLRRETGVVYSRAQVLVAMLKELDRAYKMLLAEGNAAVLEAFTEASSFARGKRIRVSTGAEQFEATTAGLEPSGALRVTRDDGREETLVAGEIFEVK